MKYKTKTGWINIHIDTLCGNRVTCSHHPYESEEVAKTGIYIGQGIQKIGTFKIEWDVPDTEE